MIRIPLTQGKIALIDDRDAHLAAYRWRAVRKPGGSWYAQRSLPAADVKRGAPDSVLLHRVILGLAGGPLPIVDHRDGDGLNCQRANLRVATPTQNVANARRARSRGASGFKGVARLVGRIPWRAIIHVNGRQVWLGRYAKASDAARAYDAAARYYFGEFACVNFPNPGERAA